MTKDKDLIYKSMKKIIQFTSEVAHISNITQMGSFDMYIYA